VRYEIEEYTVQVRNHEIDEYPNDRLPLLATPPLSMSQCAFRIAFERGLIDSRADHIATILTVRGDPGSGPGSGTTKERAGTGLES
jgi:hypothetical protein